MYFAYTSSSYSSLNGLAGAFLGVMGVIMLIGLAFIIISIIAEWKIFEKAGREGWKSLIPFYSQYVLTEISGLNGWYFLLCFIPYVGPLIWSIIVYINLAKAFGKDTGFAIGLILLTFIFMLILAFGDAKYVLGKQPTAAANGTTPNNAPTGDNTTAPTVKTIPPKEEDPWINGN